VISELEGLRVVIDRVVFVPHLDAPPERPFPFVYFITILNESETAVTVKGRKSIVTDLAGDRIVVEGDGVVGQFPRLEPGQQFSYNSYHVIGLDSVAEGAFFGITDAGASVLRVSQNSKWKLQRLQTIYKSLKIGHFPSPACLLLWLYGQRSAGPV